MRADLLALTPEAVVALANLGLVKRAQKEEAEGKGPTLVEEDDGTVVGTFADGVVTRLPRGAALKAALCSCPAPGMCRHRVAVALGYKRLVAAPEATPTEEPPTAWSPGAFDDHALARALTRGALAEAQTVLRRGVVVEVQRPEGSRREPTARLPSSVVRFLVPNEIAYARCDCALGQGCAHVALAVWAFRAADAKPDQRPVVTVELGGGEVATDKLEAARALVHELLETGIGPAREALAQRFSLAADRANAAGFTWIATGLEDLETMLARYRARSARYHPAEALALVTELEARIRVALADEPSRGELPLRFVLGQGEPPQTALDHLRLLSLGARVDSDGRERFVEIFLADPDTGGVLSLEKSWTFPEGEALPDGPALARRRVAGTCTLGQLGGGQMVSRVAKARADRTLVLGTSALAQTSVTPQTGDFSVLPPPVRVDSLRELRATLAQLPPAMLSPRLKTRDVRAVRVAAVQAAAFDAGAQCARAVVLDPELQPLPLRMPHRSASPDAGDVLVQALDGRWGAVRWVAGVMQHGPHGLSLDPTLVVADRVVVPALDAFDGKRATVAPFPAPPTDLVARRVEAACGLLEEGLQLGLGGVPQGHVARLELVARELDEVGARGLSRRLGALASVLRARRSGELVPAAPAFFDAAVRLALVRAAGG